MCWYLSQPLVEAISVNADLCFLQDPLLHPSADDFDYLVQTVNDTAITPNIVILILH